MSIIIPGVGTSSTGDLYCTLDELKNVKGIPDTADDDMLTLAIQATSRAIDNACGWRFWQDPTPVARVFNPYEPLRYCFADEPGADGISTTDSLVVKLDNDDDGTYETTLTLDTDFFMEPSNNPLLTPARPYTEIVLTGLNQWFRASYYNRSLLQITALWGWPAVPDDIHQACIIQSGDLMKSGQVSFGVAALANLDGIGMRAQAWNPLAWSLINRGVYMKPGVG